jgi:hypothetical protein
MRRAQRRSRQEGRRRIGGVLAMVFVVTDCRIQLELPGELVGRIGEDGPGVVVLGVGQERGVGVRRERIGRIYQRGLIDRWNAFAAIEQVVCGDEAPAIQEKPSTLFEVKRNSSLSVFS